MNREQFKKAALPTKEVTIPGWSDMKVTLRKMSAKDILTAGDRLSDAAGTTEAEMARRTETARAAIYSIVDPETGKLMFSDTNEDIEFFLGLGFDGFRQLEREIIAFNGLDAQAVEKNL